MLMRFDLFLIPAALICGWFLGKKRSEKPDDHSEIKLHHDYFKGLNFLINEQPDKAVDIFVKLLEVDSNTVETHLALGSLFRRQGEVDRAIRIHQNLIARPQLDKKFRLQALLALGKDYLRSGVLDRAERLFLELFNTGGDQISSLRYLLYIYQQEKDWKQAIQIASKLEHLSHETMCVPISHFHCELAELYRQEGNTKEALTHVKRSLAIDSQCARASIIRANIAMKNQQYRVAIRYFKKVVDQAPEYFQEIVTPLADCYQNLNQQAKLIAYLEECLNKVPRISTIFTIAEYLEQQKGAKAAIDFTYQQIQIQPTLRGLSYLSGLYAKHSFGDTKEKLTILKNFLSQFLEALPQYRCTQCGYSGKTLFWQCPSCHEWSMIKPIQGLDGI